MTYRQINTSKYIYIYIIDLILIRYSFMLPACRPNFSEVVRTTQKVEQAWCTAILVPPLVSAHHETGSLLPLQL